MYLHWASWGRVAFLCGRRCLFEAFAENLAWDGYRAVLWRTLDMLEIIACDWSVLNTDGISMITIRQDSLRDSLLSLRYDFDLCVFKFRRGRVLRFLLFVEFEASMLPLVSILCACLVTYTTLGLCKGLAKLFATSFAISSTFNVMLRAVPKLIFKSYLIYV